QHRGDRVVFTEQRSYLDKGTLAYLALVLVDKGPRWHGEGAASNDPRAIQAILRQLIHNTREADHQARLGRWWWWFIITAPALYQDGYQLAGDAQIGLDVHPITRLWVT